MKDGVFSLGSIEAPGSSYRQGQGNAFLEDIPSDLKSQISFWARTL